MKFDSILKRFKNRQADSIHARGAQDAKDLQEMNELTYTQINYLSKTPKIQEKWAKLSSQLTVGLTIDELEKIVRDSGFDSKEKAVLAHLAQKEKES